MGWRSVHRCLPLDCAPGEFHCGVDDIETGHQSKSDIEADADQFASYLLMPLDDFRKQVDGQTISFDLIGHCADRYGVSLTEAALRWIEIADKRAVLVASRDDYMLWAKSNEAAFKSRAFFATRKNTIEVPGMRLLIAIKILEPLNLKTSGPKFGFLANLPTWN